MIIRLPNFCECRCGSEIKSGKRFVLGHNSRVNYISWNKGLTKETDKRVAAAAVLLSGIKQSLASNRKRSLKLKGKPLTETHKHNISLALTGKIKTGIVRDKNSAALTGRAPSEETTRKIAETKQKHGKYTQTTKSVNKRMQCSGWRKFRYTCKNGTVIKMRSGWEILYAQFLDSLGIIWQYEPKGFLLSTEHRYYPDFYLPEINEYHEVKGYLSPGAKEKMDLFQKDYPNEKLVILSGKDLKKLGLDI